MESCQSQRAGECLEFAGVMAEIIVKEKESKKIRSIEQ